MPNNKREDGMHENFLNRFVGLKLIGAIFVALFVSGCDVTPSVVAKQKDPTHKVVCECQCGFSSEDVETHDVPADGCGDLNGASCTTGAGSTDELQDCSKKSVKAALTLNRLPDGNSDSALQLPEN